MFGEVADLKTTYVAYCDIRKTQNGYHIEQKCSTAFATKDMMDTVETNKNVDDSPPIRLESKTDETPVGSPQEAGLNMVTETEQQRTINRF